MSGVAAILQVLLASPTVTGLVPAARIRPGILPQNTLVPAISVERISARDLNMPNPGPTRFVTERVEVTVLAASYEQLQDVMRAVRREAADRRGVGTPLAQSAAIHTDTAGPDFYNDEGSLYWASQDFMVTFTEQR